MAATPHTLDIPGGRLHYEVRGSGPLVLLMGAPMDAGAFAGLAEALAADRTVVTHDPRGVSGSVLDDPHQDSTPDLRADDVAALLDALGAASADVFGSSGGAVTGLALAARHPGRVRTLVAHEPPLLELLPEAAEQRAATERIIETFHTQGPGAAWGAFMAYADPEQHGAAPQPAPEPVADPAADPAPAPDEPSLQDLANTEHFFAHELRGTTRYVPDTAALRAGPHRVVVGVGADSGALLTHRTSAALAALLGVAPVEFPGDHAGFLAAPDEFAAALRSAFEGA
ncbi:alpha/beta fold hydrolase [uncultured Streptomyces sp.]|uniref:alpha/beta fold hydrolase n=1 Tax=uncultured Streptomyces sp. TaxID=174707 RepID=UPI00262C091B|nr:alpha/beta hydrolase [uncultured Streptomyces sp.]